MKAQFLIALALLAGVAIGYFAGGHGESRPAGKEEPALTRRAIADKGDQATIAALRKEVAALKKALVERNAKAAEMPAKDATAEKVASQPQNRPPNPREWLENLKRTDPARYTQMTNRFAQWRQRRAVEARSKIDFLSSIDTSRMSAAARKTHGRLQELIAQREEIEARLHQSEQISDEQRDALMKEMRQTNDDIRRLNGEERDNLLAEVSRNLGFEGDEANDFAATIQEVIEATDNGWGGRHRHHGGPGGPRGQGGPGGR